MKRGNETRTNSDIDCKEVRLVDDSGEMVGVVPTAEAIVKAKNIGLDLVEISPNAEPPVCKILDYGKFRYEAQRKAKDAKKKQKVIHIKEIKLRTNIGQHDYMTKMKNSRKFIESEDKVKFSIKFRGREMTHIDLGKDLLNRVIEDMSDIARVEQEPKMEGRQMILIIAPLK